MAVPDARSIAQHPQHDEPSITNDSRVPFLPRAITANWKPSVDPRSDKEEIAQNLRLLKRLYQKEFEIAGSMKRAGVEFLAGTDVGNPYCFPGFSLHDKLRALDEMLSNAEALASKSKIPMMLALGSRIEEQGVDAAIRQYRELKSAQPETYDFSEEGLNSLGYQLLGNKKLREAIQIFRLNVEAYPQSANVYDSLGEAYLNAGEKELAIRTTKNLSN